LIFGFSLFSSSVESESQPLLKDSEMAEEDGDAPKTKQCAHNLWVDKYAPRHYTHLLSDDGINRTLLSWIKLWDETVFGHSSLSSSTANVGTTYSTAKEKGE
jgi:hypothetical protein